MVDPSILRTLAGWCRVFHQSTENLMIGDVDEADKGHDAGNHRGAARLPSMACQMAM